MSNVVALNFSYDVPVKLYSMHLLAQAVFLLLPELRRLVDFFFLNRPAGSVTTPPLFTRKLWQRGALVFSILFLIAVTGTTLYQSYAQRRDFITQHSPFYGVWEVEEVKLGQPGATAAAQNWRRIVFDSPNRIGVQTTDRLERYGSQLDEEKRTLTLRKRDDPTWNTVLTYEKPSFDVMTLAGTFNGSDLTLRLRRSVDHKFLLTDRGFHWINEFPFNR